jgi:hypothetical protein
VLAPSCDQRSARSARFLWIGPQRNLGGGRPPNSITVNTPDVATPTTFATLALDEWFEDRATESFWLRIVSAIGLPPADMQALVARKSLHLFAGGPLVIAYGKMNDFKLPVFHFVVYAAEDGAAVMYSHLNELELPSMNVWFLATSLRTKDGMSFDGESKATLDRASALVQLHIGRNVLRDIVFDGSVNGLTGRISVASRAIRTPDAADGPASHERLWEALNELRDPMVALPREKRERLFRSLEFIEKAILNGSARNGSKRYPT